MVDTYTATLYNCGAFVHTQRGAKHELVVLGVSLAPDKQELRLLLCSAKPVSSPHLLHPGSQYSRQRSCLTPYLVAWHAGAEPPPGSGQLVGSFPCLARAVGRQPRRAADCDGAAQLSVA